MCCHSCCCGRSVSLLTQSYVHPQLEQIFDYRQQAFAGLFGSVETTRAASAPAGATSGHGSA
jgi:hypothetical protein